MQKIVNKKSRFASLLLLFVLLALAVVFAVPLYIAVVNIFKPTQTISASPLSLPLKPTLQNILTVLNSPNVNVYRMYMNSILITVFGASVCILVSSLAAYYLSRVKSRLSNMLYVYFLFGLMVPYVIVYVPLVAMYSRLNLIGNLPSLILIFVSGSISFSVFMYHGFIGGISQELEEAAVIDGAGDMVIFARIIMPLVKPCTTTVAIFIGLSMWNDFLTPLLIGQVKTITVGIYTAIGPYASDWGSVFAYVMFATLPIVVAYVCAQNQFVSGLTAGAVKG